MRSPHEGPTASRFSLRRPRGPRKFVAASLAFDILSRDRFREESIFPWYASGVHTTGYRFVVSSPEGPTGWRGLLARGPLWPEAYWPEGPTGLPLVSGGGFGPGGLPLGYANARRASIYVTCKFGISGAHGSACRGDKRTMGAKHLHVHNAPHSPTSHGAK